LQGNYGTRKVNNIRTHGPPDWTVEVFEAPRFLPQIIDDPAEFLPESLPQVDLVLSLAESSSVAQLIPDIARLSGARAVIAPIDNTAWLPPGLKNQLQRELAASGVATAFPKPFCTLTQDTYGYRRSAEHYENHLIASFAQHFGKPELKITVDPETKTIEKVDVVRDATCGSARFVAQGLVGVSVEEAEFEAGMLHHHYPCLASMTREWIDDRLEDTLMHVAGYVIRDEVARQVKPFKKPVPYITPDGYVSGRENSPG
jgi:hypothetical protein